MNDQAKAVIVGESIVIRVDHNALPLIIAAGCGVNPYDGYYIVTDAESFAPYLCQALNREDDDGTTPLHKVIDEAVSYALEFGAEGCEEVSEEAFEGYLADTMFEAQEK